MSGSNWECQEQTCVEFRNTRRFVLPTAPPTKETLKKGREGKGDTRKSEGAQRQEIREEGTREVPRDASKEPLKVARADTLIRQ